MKMRSSTYFALIIVGAFTLFGLSACQSEEKSAPSDRSPVSVETATARLTNIQRNQQFSGTVQGTRRINMSTKVMGQITRINVEEGDFAEQGDRLLHIKDDNLKARKEQVDAQLSQARANLENTEKNYNRIQNLYKNGSATQKEYDDMKTRLESAKSSVKSLEGKRREIEDMLSYTTIRAPIDGYIVRKLVEQGDMASPGKPLLTIENIRTLEIKATIPESQVNLVKVGDSLRIKVPAADRLRLKGRITSINPSGNRGSRQFSVKAVFRETGPEQRIKPGMYAELWMSQPTDPAITVHKKALIERGQLTGLYTLNSNREAVLRWVRTGYQSGDRIEILSGIAEGESYIISPDGRIAEGQKVEIQ